jgi:hypothetical protein
MELFYGKYLEIHNKWFPKERDGTWNKNIFLFKWCFKLQVYVESFFLKKPIPMLIVGLWVLMGAFYLRGFPFVLSKWNIPLVLCGIWFILCILFFLCIFENMRFWKLWLLSKWPFPLCNLRVRKWKHTKGEPFFTKKGDV